MLRGMSWTLSARGTKAKVLDVITRQSLPLCDSDAAQLAGAKQLLAVEVHAAPEGAEVTVSASGRRDEHGCGYVSVTVNASAPVTRTADQSPVD